MQRAPPAAAASALVWLARVQRAGCRPQAAGVCVYGKGTAERGASPSPPPLTPPPSTPRQKTKKETICPTPLGVSDFLGALTRAEPTDWSTYGWQQYNEQGNITAVTALFNAATGCLDGLRATYGEKPNPASLVPRSPVLGSNASGLVASSWKLAPKERIVGVAYKLGVRFVEWCCLCCCCCWCVCVVDDVCCVQGGDRCIAPNQTP